MLCCGVLCPVQVLHPVEYAKVVQRIGNEMDLTQVQSAGKTCHHFASIDWQGGDSWICTAGNQKQTDC